jgi:polysaccharide pyruvyl transferase WcaK-like protein
MVRVARPLVNRAGPPKTVSDASARFADPLPPIRPSAGAGPTIVLLNDCQDQDNFGAIALVDGLVRILQDAVPQATIAPIPSHWLLDVSGGFGAFANRGAGLRQLYAAYPAIADQFESVADDWLRGDAGPGAQELLKRLRRAELVVLNGEGSVYRTNVSAIRELFLAWLCKARLGIPTVFVNATVHLTDVMPILPAMARKTLPILDAVAVREPYSLRNLEHYVPEVDVRLIPDSAFALVPDDARATPMTGRVRARFGDAPYFCFDPGPMPIDDRPGRVSAVYRLIMGLKDVVPHAVFVRGDPSDNLVDGIAEETDSLHFGDTADYHEWMTVVRDAEFLVTGRYHNLILSAVMGCPAISFASSSHKIHGACELLESVGHPYDPTDLSTVAASIVDHARGYAEHRAAIGAELQQVCARRRNEVAELGSLVAVLLSQSRASGGAAEPVLAR